MGVTAKLLKLHRVDQQLTGLKSRLRASEALLTAQQRKLDEAEQLQGSIASQLKQLEATAHNDETESKGIDERIAVLRERMNTAKTSKEHSAMLVEINTLKADKSLLDDRALGALSKIDELRAKHAEVKATLDELLKIRDHAKTQRDERAGEIKARVAELETERTEVAKDVPSSAMAIYSDRLERNDEDVMAEVEEIDRRNMEYTCTACFTHLPVELVNSLLNRGDLVTCPSCRAILYINEELRDSIQSAAEKKRKKREVASD